MNKFRRKINVFHIKLMYKCYRSSFIPKYWRYNHLLLYWWGEDGGNTLILRLNLSKTHTIEFDEISKIDKQAE